MTWIAITYSLLVGKKGIRSSKDPYKIYSFIPTNPQQDSQSEERDLSVAWLELGYLGLPHRRSRGIVEPCHIDVIAKTTYMVRVTKLRTRHAYEGTIRSLVDMAGRTRIYMVAEYKIPGTFQEYLEVILKKLGLFWLYIILRHLIRVPK